MAKLNLLLSLALLGTLALAGTPPCPIQYQIGSLISARVIVAQQQSLVTLVSGVDTQCYNYSLPYAFATVPDVAIAVHDFESRTTNDLFFSIKPVLTESLAYVPFLIRTHWKYTAWTKIGFSFLAEDRKDMEAGYYQIDSGALGGCEPGKDIKVMLPFRDILTGGGNINHNLFLHGFEISSQSYNSSAFSPFEIQIAYSAANASGIAALISVTTITQVHAIHISYLAWSVTTLNLVSGSFTYEMSASYEIVHTPTANIGRNYARLHGLTGFIIKHNSQSIGFSTTWTGSKFVFDLATSQKLTQYFSFQYLFFIGSECSDCTGYPFISQGRCVSVCPAGQYPTTEKTCIECGDGYFWDGAKCQKLCPEGQYLNIATNECECPAGLHWTGTICLGCNNGRVFMNQTKTCECPEGTRWNGFSCAKVDPCTNGKEYDIFTFTCKCPIGTNWNGTYCYKPPSCRGGQYLNAQLECVCPPNTYFRDGFCQATGCTGGQKWNGQACVCETGYNFNGSICLLCINGQTWNERSKSCQCETGFRWNGNYCEEIKTCSGGRIYNEKYSQCLCPDGNFWNGAQCMVKPNCCCGKRWNEKTFKCECPEGFNYDGSTCVLCTAGKTWDSATNRCICPAGTQWNNQFCTVIQNCYGGMIWNQNTWACECPSSTVWNNNYCIANPCKNGQVWDNQQKICRCVNGFIIVNGFCSPPEISCKYGKTWNPARLVCECPAGTWDSGSACVPIKVCVSNQIYSPNNNQCICDFGLVWLANKNVCGDPTCPLGQRWDGNGCVDISCPPNSYYNGSVCICPDPSDYCLPWENWNGEECVYYQDTCPKGTRWDGSMCKSTGQCPDGFYSEGTSCKPLPQRCLPPTTWGNGKCNVGSSCPYGTFKSGSSCQPYTQCQNGQMWNSDMIQCVCPEGTGWNGIQCVTCGGGQIWNLYEGCVCPEGYFFSGNQCEEPSQVLCRNIPHAYWNSANNKCLCDPGFTVVGYQCICKGVPFEHFCDRCAHRPNSEWRFGICQCKTGYTLYGTECLPNQNDGDDRAADCSVGTYFDKQQNKCLSCPDGCLSCVDCYTCNTCSPDFIYDAVSQLCIERCGDGKRFNVECDDGNVASGDGCDISCKIEPGYTCRGGSPNDADQCIVYNPVGVTLIQTGQIRYSTKIVINVKLDYMPLDLLQSLDCQDRCSQVLLVKLTGETAARIKASFISGSRYAFSIEIEFDRPYIAQFSADIKVNPSLSRYFTGVSISNGLNVNVNPAFLSKAENGNSKEKLN